MNFMLIISIVDVPIGKTLCFVTTRSNIEGMNTNATISVTSVRWV